MERTTTRRDRTAGTTTWTRNANGNLVAKLDDVWATVYRDGKGYRSVYKHRFSRETYATEREACAAACRSV